MSPYSDLNTKFEGRECLLDERRVLITGGTGSLGQALARRILSGVLGTPASVTVFSRDEAKQHAMRLAHLNRPYATDDAAYEDRSKLRFVIGDVREYSSVVAALRDSDVVFNVAALKQVPTCEYAPYQAVMTNVLGPENIVRAIKEHNLPIELVVGVSTDKACKPINVMGMTKALQERVFTQANLRCPKTKFVCVRYGNVIGSRGSVIPLFLEQIRNGGPVSITSFEMTRFLLSLDQAVNTVLATVLYSNPGETFVPRCPAARIADVAQALIGSQKIIMHTVGIRPGEKLHEILIAEDECYRTLLRNGYYVVQPILPEIARSQIPPALTSEYSSLDNMISGEQLAAVLGIAEQEKVS